MKSYGRTLITDSNSVLKNTFRLAYSQGVINRDPTVGLEKPKAKTQIERRELTDKETKAVLSVAGRSKYGILLYLLYYTGCRIGEVLGLQWGDIDFDGKLIHIERDVDFRTYAIGEVKSRSSIRDIPIPSMLVLALRKHLLVSGRPANSAHVIQAPQGGFVDKLKTYHRIWHNMMAELAEVDPSIEVHAYEPDSRKKKQKNPKPSPLRSVLTAHYFRHNYASLLYNAGIDLLTAQKWLGHSDPKTTLSIYMHLSKKNESKNIEKMDDLIFKL